MLLNSLAAYDHVASFPLLVFVQKWFMVCLSLPKSDLFIKLFCPVVCCENDQMHSFHFCLIEGLLKIFILTVFVISLSISNMKSQRKSITLINLMLCIVLMVCSLYYEPIVMHRLSDGRTESAMLLRPHTISTVESEPVVLADKSEQARTHSIRESSPRRPFARYRLATWRDLSTGCHIYSAILLKTSIGLYNSVGASLRLEAVLSYIWSQIGL